LYHSAPSQQSRATLPLYKRQTLAYNIGRKRREHLLD